MVGWMLLKFFRDEYQCFLRPRVGGCKLSSATWTLTDDYLGGCKSACPSASATRSSPVSALVR